MSSSHKNKPIVLDIFQRTVPQSIQSTRSNASITSSTHSSMILPKFKEQPQIQPEASKEDQNQSKAMKVLRGGKKACEYVYNVNKTIIGKIGLKSYIVVFMIIACLIILKITGKNHISKLVDLNSGRIKTEKILTQEPNETSNKIQKKQQKEYENLKEIAPAHGSQSLQIFHLFDRLI